MAEQRRVSSIERSKLAQWVVYDATTGATVNLDTCSESRCLESGVNWRQHVAKSRAAFRLPSGAGDSSDGVYLWRSWFFALFRGHLPEDPTHDSEACECE